MINPNDPTLSQLPATTANLVFKAICESDPDNAAENLCVAFRSLFTTKACDQLCEATVYRYELCERGCFDPRYIIVNIYNQNEPYRRVHTSLDQKGIDILAGR